MKNTGLPGTYHFTGISCKKWLNGWIEEFICDLVATYLVGPAYAWANLKLSTINSGNDRIYIDNPSHPSDEAKMRAIFHMLDITGEDSEAVKIKDSWNKFLVATANPIPPDYKFISLSIYLSN